MAYGSCRDLIDNYFNEGLPESASCIILKETLQGLEYIHNKGYIHRQVSSKFSIKITCKYLVLIQCIINFRGIRASHILINSTGNVCLAGLRSAGSLLLQGKRQKSLHCLPPANHNNKSLIWLSPELLEQVHLI